MKALCNLLISSMSEVEAYFKEHNLSEIVGRGLAELYQSNPLNPFEHLAQFFSKYNDSNQCGKQVCSNAAQLNALIHPVISQSIAERNTGKELSGTYLNRMPSMNSSKKKNRPRKSRSSSIFKAVTIHSSTSKTSQNISRKN